MLGRSGTQRVFSSAMTLTALRRHPLFGGLPLEHIERLSTYASIRAYSRGATIFTKGDRGTSLFVVCSGTIRIAVSSPDGRNAVYNLTGSRGRRTRGVVCASAENLAAGRGRVVP